MVWVVVVVAIVIGAAVLVAAPCMLSSRIGRREGRND